MAYMTGITPLRMVDKPPYTVEVPGSVPVPGETIPRRHPKAVNGLLERPAPDINTVYDLIKRSATKFANEPAVGSRKLLNSHKETKKVRKMVDGEVREVDKEWTYFELSDYSFMTYPEYFDLVLQVGSGLRKLGLTSADKVHIFASTSLQWLTIAHACSSQSMAIVTAYDTLGEDGVGHSLIQTGVAAMFVDPQLVKTARKALGQAKAMRYLIYNDMGNQPATPQQVADFKAAHPALTIVSFSELRAMGEAEPVEPVPPTPEQTYCVMYTSGSTGVPKGVPVTHGSFVAAVAGLYAVLEECVSHREVVLAYLPLAHMFELILENAVLFVGATLGYGSPRTLTDGSMRHCVGDIRALRPTIMVGVPQIWETVRKGVVHRVDESGALARAVFWGAFGLKSFLVRNGLPGASLLDGLAFAPVRRTTGGRLRFIINGASGIAEPTLHFMSLVVAPMISGYGLTETCANGALGSPLQWTATAIGPVPAAVEVKLVSLPEIGYTTDGPGPAQGEILIRGRPVVAAYYDNPEESAKALSPDGWFRTGDIGEFDANGHLRVFDRIKNLVKLQGGEYVALEKLEAVYRGAPAVASVMVHGDSAHPRPIAVVVPNEPALAERAALLGVDVSGGGGGLHHDPRVRAEVLQELLAVGREAGLSPMEMVQGVVLADDEWTPSNGLVTATHKVNRRVLREKYKKEIAKCFASS